MRLREEDHVAWGAVVARAALPHATQRSVMPLLVLFMLIRLVAGHEFKTENLVL